jgi:hypothetical protein
VRNIIVPRRAGPAQKAKALQTEVRMLNARHPPSRDGPDGLLFDDLFGAFFQCPKTRYNGGLCVIIPERD